MKEAIAITRAGGDLASRKVDENNNQVMFKIQKLRTFTDCICKITNTKVDDAIDLDVTMFMYNLIEYSINNRRLWQHLKRYSESFKVKVRIIGRGLAAGNTKDVEIAVPLKYLSNFWRTHEKPLINCEINLMLVSKLCHYQLNWCRDICNITQKSLCSQW